MELKEKIDFIYEKIANKDLSFGCCFQGEKSSYVIQNPYWCFVWWDWRIYSDCCDSELNTQIKVEKIIGHPVMIGDVIDFIEKNTQGVEPEQKKWEGVIKIQLWCSRDKAIEILTDHIIFVWRNKRFSIEEQSDECINFIYNLILCTKNIKN